MDHITSMVYIILVICVVGRRTLDLHPRPRPPQVARVSVCLSSKVECTLHSVINYPLPRPAAESPVSPDS